VVTVTLPSLQCKEIVPEYPGAAFEHSCSPVVSWSIAAVGPALYALPSRVSVPKLVIGHFNLQVEASLTVTVPLTHASVIFPL